MPFPLPALTDPNPSWALAAIARLQDAMSDDLLKPEWRGGPTRTAGHCYAASEALFHALGCQAEGWKSMTMRFGAGTHWFLKHQDGTILDPTWDQFGVPVPYEQGRGAGFLTVKPSKRAQTMLARSGLTPNGLMGIKPSTTRLVTQDETQALHRALSSPLTPAVTPRARRRA